MHSNCTMLRDGEHCVLNLFVHMFEFFPLFFKQTNAHVLSIEMEPFGDPLAFKYDLIFRFRFGHQSAR